MTISSLLLSVALLQSGGKLEIKDVVVGTGQAAKANDILTLNYTGKLLNGKVFDTSKKPGRTPFQFLLGASQVIKGWDQGVVGMKVGGKRMLTIPADLAYGAQSPSPDIPANSTLMFEVELLGVHPCDVMVSKVGTGPGAKMGDTVDFQLTVSLKGGKKLGSSLDKPGKPPVHVSLSPQAGIPTPILQALIGAKSGEVRKVTVSTDYFPGFQPNAQVPAKSTFVYDIEMVKVAK